MPHQPMPAARAPRRRALAAWSLAVLTAHVMVMAAWLRASNAGGPPAAARAVRLRLIAEPPASPALPAPGAGPQVLGAIRRATPPAAPRARGAAHGQPQAPGPAEAAPPSATAGETPLPVYATVLPPPVQLRYTLRRGDALSDAELSWQPEPGRYTLNWRGSAIDGQPMGRASQGSLEEHGIEPERYAESRRGREQRAVNFQREAGLISFSGAQRRVALVAGAQDRLSWMLQLAGVMAADPTLGAPGRGVSMLVAGPRGEAAGGLFCVVALEPGVADAGLQEGPLLHLRREALRPYDTQVDVWLDPARHHLPARVRMRTHPDGATAELTLHTLAAIP